MLECRYNKTTHHVIIIIFVYNRMQGYGITAQVRRILEMPIYFPSLHSPSSYLHYMAMRGIFRAEDLS